MNTKIVKTLVKKELLDIFRDKKTVIMMLVVPVIMYPLIFIGAMQIVTLISSGMEQQNYRIAIEAEDGDVFRNQLMQVQRRTANAGAKESAEKSASIKTAEEEDVSYEITVVDAGLVTDYETALNEENIDVYVSCRTEGGKPRYDVYYLSSVTNSGYAADIVMEAFDALKEGMTRQRIAEAGLNIHEILEPVRYESKDIASHEQSLGSIMGSVLPFMLIISLVMGTVYPAIDTTAGERERGTLETILTLPVTNRQLIFSKFITVAAVGMVSALFNILSMGGIAFYMYQIMEMQTDTGSFDMGKFIPAIVVCVLAVFAFSLFISAVTMCVTSFAKSYMEANNYVSPLMLVVMFTGYIGFIPNLELTQTMAMLPVANICLLVKNMLAFKVDYAAIAAVLLSNVAYAVIAILFLSKIYDSEALLFSEQKGNLQLFEKRSNLRRGGVPAAPDVWFVAALLILLTLYAGSLLQLKFGLAGVFGTQMILLFVPLAMVIYTKKDIRQTYGFAGTKAAAYPGGMLMAAGCFFINIVLATGLMALFPESGQNVETAFSQIMGDSGVGVALFVIALTPAVCEEMLFRGLFFHSLKARYRPLSAVLVTAVLFGLYHMSLVKFIPTGLMGLMFGLVVWRTGSIFPAMLMHFLNNACSIFISYYPEQIGGVFPVFYKEAFRVSDALLLCGVGLVLAGAGWAMLPRRHDK